MRLYKRGGGDAWWATWFDNGKTVRRSTKTADKHAAQRVVAQWELERVDPVYAAAKEATVAQSVRELYVTLRQSATSAGTLDMYETKLGHIVRLLGATRMADVNVTKVDAYFKARQAEGVSGSTLLKEWACLSRVLKHAKRRDLFNGDLEKLRPDWIENDSKPGERYLTWEQIPIVLAALPPERREFVAFCIGSGARLGEAMRFVPEDLDRTTWHLRIRGTKTAGSARTIVVPTCFRGIFDHVAGPFAVWKDMYHTLGRLHERLTREERARAVRDGRAPETVAPFPRLSPNDLRRTFASLLAQAGAPLSVVAKLLGHTSADMVYRTYGKFTPDTLGALVDAGISGFVPVAKSAVSVGVPVTTETEPSAETLDASETFPKVIPPPNLARNSGVGGGTADQPFSLGRPHGDSNPG